MFASALIGVGFVYPVHVPGVSFVGGWREMPVCDTKTPLWNTDNAVWDALGTRLWPVIVVVIVIVVVGPATCRTSG